MKKTVNAKWLAFKYKLAKRLNTSIEYDKNAIKEGAKITFKDYCKIQIVECTRAYYDKEEQAKLDKLAEENCIAKKVTHFKRIDIDDIPNETDIQVEQALNILENSNNKDIKRIANKVAKIK